MHLLQLIGALPCACSGSWAVLDRPGSQWYDASEQLEGPPSAAPSEVQHPAQAPSDAPAELSQAGQEVNTGFWHVCNIFRCWPVT